jgi:tetratricopeptide (TPR) repeat protein
LNLGGRIDPRTIPDVLKEATELHQARKLVEAERGYRQVLDTDASNADAIHRLGQLLATRGDHAAAKRLFKTLTAIRPDAYKSWLCLGQASEALGQHLEAANAYREVVELRPDLPDAFNGLARILLKLGRVSELNAALVAVLDREVKPPVRNGRETKSRRVLEHRTSQDRALSL